MILRELLTQRQSRIVLLAYGGGGGGGERRGKTGRGGEFGSLSFPPYLFFLRLPLNQSVFFVLCELPSRRVTPHT